LRGRVTAADAAQRRLRRVQLTPGPATVLVDLRGRRRVAISVTVPAACVLTLDFAAGARGQ